jgi:hypothetical protein
MTGLPPLLEPPPLEPPLLEPLLEPLLLSPLLEPLLLSPLLEPLLLSPLLEPLLLSPLLEPLLEPLLLSPLLLSVELVVPLELSLVPSAPPLVVSLTSDASVAAGSASPQWMQRSGSPTSGTWRTASLMRRDKPSMRFSSQKGFRRSTCRT